MSPPETSPDMPASISFARFSLPTGPAAWIPDDIELRLPVKSMLDAVNLHYPVYLPSNFIMFSSSGKPRHRPGMRFGGLFQSVPRRSVRLERLQQLA
jgi:hypothetical protein